MNNSILASNGILCEASWASTSHHLKFPILLCVQQQLFHVCFLAFTVLCYNYLKVFYTSSCSKYLEYRSVEGWIMLNTNPLPPKKRWGPPRPCEWDLTWKTGLWRGNSVKDIYMRSSWIIKQALNPMMHLMRDRREDTQKRRPCEGHVQIWKDCSH